MTDEYDARANEALILGKKLYAICRGRRTEAAGYGASYLLAMIAGNTTDPTAAINEIVAVALKVLPNLVKEHQ